MIRPTRKRIKAAQGGISLTDPFYAERGSDALWCCGGQRSRHSAKNNRVIDIEGTLKAMVATRLKADVSLS